MGSLDAARLVRTCPLMGEWHWESLSSKSVRSVWLWLFGYSCAMLVLTIVGCLEEAAERLATCLKHSWPHGSEYPKQGPSSSQFDFMSFMKDAIRCLT